MIPPCSAIRLRIVCIQILTLLVMAPGELLAIQIAPNPNPQFNAITITPSSPGENFVPFSNLGLINIEPLASFTNRASGFYYNGGGSTHINGTFINEGAVEHNSIGFAVSETGQYIQRQDANSFVTPTTVNRDMVFSNAGHVSITAGEFINRPFGIYAQTGTTQIDGVFQNSGRVINDGQITVGKTGLYEHQNAFPGLPSNQGGLTVNNGVFLNGGTTNINTGVFENKGDFRNNAVGLLSDRAIVRIGEGALFSNIRTIPVGTAPVSGLYLQEAGGTTRIDGGFDNRGSVSNEGTIAVGTTGTYTQSPGGGTGNAGLFQNEGRVSVSSQSGFLNTGRYVQLATGTTEIGGIFGTHFQVSNAGAITVGTTGEYLQDRVPGVNTPVPSTTMNSGTFTNAGTVHIGEGTSFSNVSDRGSPAAQYLQQASGTTQIDGTFQNGGARVENAGTMTVGTTGTYLQAFNKFVPVVSTTINTGTFTNAGSTLINGGTFTNQGNVVNSGTFQVGIAGTAGFIDHGSVVNSGTFEVGTLGQVSGGGSYVQNAAAAQTIVNGTFAHNISLQAGSLSGIGTITGAVMNTGGVVQPGSSIVPGTLTMANYTQGIYGRLDLKIGGLVAGSQYDVLKVTGPGTFGGSLFVRLINGFTPGLGNSFNLLACSLGCSGLNGGTLFSGGVSLPSLASGLAWVSGLNDGGNSFSFTVVAAAASAPEPGMLLLVGSGFVGLVGWRRRQPVHTIGQ